MAVSVRRVTQATAGSTTKTGRSWKLFRLLPGEALSSGGDRRLKDSRTSRDSA
ncbi:hypothetical protein Cadr_000001217 [Camelus dromedarius]|uniref:Uncharacterized protein n=1 Tax=Camelus dromedarius TaxID=9838 RepID=A0A5N4EI39_CAMDR|nr:hypothetical protein Cadr_000001217 [Camelus dromedarius]